MASVTELFESGDGDSISDRGDASVSRLFHVVVDAPSDGERETPADYVLRGGTQANPITLTSGDIVPLGSPHPDGFAKDRAGLYAARYTVENRVSPQNHIVRVDYMMYTWSNYGDAAGWLFSFSPGLGTKRLLQLTSVNDPITGQHLSEPIVVDIGPRQYETWVSGDKYYATVVDNTAKPFKKVERELQRVSAGAEGGDARRIQGVDDTFPIGTIQLTRTLKNYPDYLHSWLMSRRETTNRYTFLTRRPGRLKFVGPSVSNSGVAMHGGSSRSNPGHAWTITLNIEDTEDIVDINAGGQVIPYDYVLQDTHEEFGQTVAIVDSDGKTQPTFYKLKESIDFSQILFILDAFGNA